MKCGTPPKGKGKENIYDEPSSSKRIQVDTSIDIHKFL
jgi:hypothetical protein